MSDERKRQRVEGTIPPISVDVTDLCRRLANHVPLDQNKVGILSVLAEIGLQGTPPAVKNQSQTNDEQQHDTLRK